MNYKKILSNDKHKYITQIHSVLLSIKKRLKVMKNMIINNSEIVARRNCLSGEITCINVIYLRFTLERGCRWEGDKLGDDLGLWCPADDAKNKNCYRQISDPEQIDLGKILIYQGPKWTRRFTVHLSKLDNHLSLM